jgi:hypothetical protein
MYQGYPSGYMSQQYKESPMRSQMHSQSMMQQRPEMQQRAREVIPHSEVCALNKRSLNSPSFIGNRTERTKRTDNCETPIKDDSMEELEHLPDPAGQHCMT